MRRPAAACTYITRYGCLSSKDGLLRAQAAQVAERKAGREVTVRAGASSGAQSHAFGWRDAMDIAVKWRQLAEPNDQVLGLSYVAKALWQCSGRCVAVDMPSQGHAHGSCMHASGMDSYCPMASSMESWPTRHAAVAAGMRAAVGLRMCRTGGD